jgi:hypothetical protein
MVKVDYSMLFSAALAAMILICASSEGRPQSHYHRRKFFKQHYDKVNGFVCSTPQRRLVQLKDLGIAIRPDVSYYPSATVLKKCDCATGYCRNPEEACSANVTDEVELVFLLKKQVDGENQKYEYITVNATEHISCSCQPIEDQIK